MDESTPMTDEEFEQWQADRLLNRTAGLRTELVMVDQKLQALSEFMDLAKSKEDVLENWLIEQQLNADYPGAQRALHVQPDGTVRFLDLNDWCVRFFLGHADFDPCRDRHGINELVEINHSGIGVGIHVPSGPIISTALHFPKVALNPNSASMGGSN